MSRNVRPALKPTNIADGVHPPDGRAEGLVETGQGPVVRQIRMHYGRNPPPLESEFHLRFRLAAGIAVPGFFEFALIDGPAEFRYEPLHETASFRAGAPGLAAGIPGGGRTIAVRLPRTWSPSNIADFAEASGLRMNS